MGMTREEILVILQKTKREVQAIQVAEDRYVYFLLATSAAEIAYAMQRTSTSPITSYDCWLGFAVGCWAASFSAGCRNRLFVMNMASTQPLVSMFSGGIEVEAKRLGKSDQEIRDIQADADPFIARLRKDRRTTAIDAMLWFGLQFWLIVAGAIFFVIWHTVGMAIRTPNALLP